MQHACVCKLPLLLCLRCSTSMCIMHFTIHGVTLLCILDFGKFCVFIFMGSHVFAIAQEPALYSQGYKLSSNLQKP